MRIIFLDLQVDTLKETTPYYNQNPIAFYQHRVESLEYALNFLTREIAICGINNAKVDAILVAPEYFFARPGDWFGAGDPVQYLEEDARKIEKSLVRLSQRYSKILIIPGTVAWQKNIVKPAPPPIAGPTGMFSSFSLTGTRSATESRCEELLPCKPIDPNTYAYEKRSRGIIKKATFEYGLNAARRNIGYGIVARHQDTFGRIKQLADNPDDLNSFFVQNTVNASSSPSTFEEKKGYIDKIFVEKPYTLIATHNTLYFYLNGERVYKYHKYTDYEEVKDGVPKVHLPGDMPPFVQIEGINFGIEICFDHCHGILSRHLTSSFNYDYRSKHYELKYPMANTWKQDILTKGGVDIHLVLSAYTENQEDFYYAKRGGYFIHSSSEDSVRCCLKRTDVSQQDRYNEENSTLTETPLLHPCQYKCYFLDIL